MLTPGLPDGGGGIHRLLDPSTFGPGSASPPSAARPILSSLHGCWPSPAMSSLLGTVCTYIYLVIHKLLLVYSPSGHMKIQAIKARKKKYKVVRRRTASGGGGCDGAR
jgi:hypothetical protein